MQADHWIPEVDDSAATDLEERLEELRSAVADQWSLMGRDGAATSEVTAAREAEVIAANAYRSEWESIRSDPSSRAPEAQEALEVDWAVFVQARELAYGVAGLVAPEILGQTPDQTTPDPLATAGPASVAAAVHATLPASSGPPSRGRSHSSAAAEPTAVAQPAAPRRHSMPDRPQRRGPR